MAQITNLPLEIVLSEDYVRLFVYPGGEEGRRKQYYVDTTIYVRHADGCFPDDSWFDSTNIVLWKWEYSILSHIGYKSASYDLPFVDQDCFKMRVKQNGNHLTVEGVNKWMAFGPVVEFTVECTVQDMLHAMLDAYKQYKRIVFTSDCIQKESEVQQELLNTISKGRDRIRQALLDLGEREVAEMTE